MNQENNVLKKKKLNGFVEKRYAEGKDFLSHHFCCRTAINMTNFQTAEMVTFHTTTVVAFVALRSFAAEHKECPMETSVLTRNWCINLTRWKGKTHKCWL